MKCAAPARRWIWQSFTAFDRHVMATVKSATSHTRLLEATRKISVRGGWACHCALRQPLAFVYSSAVQATPSDQSVPVSLQQVEDRMGALNTRPTVPDAPPVVVVISGPSGVGKDAVISALKAARPNLYFVVTATSRAMRKGEVHGKDYIFVAKEEFEGWVKDDLLLEHAVVYGEYKGIPKQQVANALACGTDVVMRIDVQGAATIRRLLPDSIFVFLVAESEQVLVQRLTQRKTEPLDSMLVRIETSKAEVEHMSAFDYVVVNKEGELVSTVNQIAAIIDAEKCSVDRRLPKGKVQQ